MAFSFHDSGNPFAFVGQRLIFQLKFHHENDNGDDTFIGFSLIYYQMDRKNKNKVYSGNGLLPSTLPFFSHFYAHFSLNTHRTVIVVDRFEGISVNSWFVHKIRWLSLRMHGQRL